MSQRKLFKKHNVINVYFEGKDITYEDKYKEMCKFNKHLQSLFNSINRNYGAGNCYLFPYTYKNHNTSYVYVKIGIRQSITRNDLMKFIKNYHIKNDKIKIRTHEFYFKNSHYTIEALKFTGYFFGVLVGGELLNNYKFKNNELRKFNKLSGDKLSKFQKGRLTQDEWLNMIHHMFLSLNIDYDEEALIYGLGKERIQFNLNRGK